MDSFLDSVQKTISENPTSFPAANPASAPLSSAPVSAESHGEFKEKVDFVTDGSGEQAIMSQMFGTREPIVSNDTTTAETITNDTTPTSAPQINWEELTGGRFKSWDEVAPIINEYETLKNTPQETFANDAVKRFNDYVAKGGKVDKEWMRKAFADYDAMEDPYQILTEKFALEGLSDDEIEYKLVSEYGKEMDPEGESLEERAMRAKVKREVNKAKEELKRYQNEVVWTAEGDDKLNKYLSEQKAQQEAFEAQMKAINERIDKDLAAVKLSKIPVSVTDKDANLNISVEFDAGDTKEVMAYVSELTKNTGQAVYNRYKKDDGTFDMAKMALDEYKLRNFDDIVRKVAVNAYAKGAKNEVLAMKNISALHKEEPINVTDLKTRQEQAVLDIIKGIR